MLTHGGVENLPPTGWDVSWVLGEPGSMPKHASQSLSSWRRGCSRSQRYHDGMVRTSRRALVVAMVLVVLGGLGWSPPGQAARQAAPLAHAPGSWTAGP